MSNEIRPIGGLENFAICWGIAALAGFGTMALLYTVGDWTAIQAIFTGGAIGFAIGVVLTVMMGRPLSPPGAARPSGEATMTQSARTDLAPRNVNKVLTPVPSPSRSTPDVSAISDTKGPDLNSPAVNTAKGSGGASGSASVTQSASADAAPANVAPKGVPPIGAAAAADERATAREEAKSSGPLPVGAAALADETAAPAPEPAPPAAASSGAPAAPERLSAARDGGADDLKKIKGVGPKLEKLLHSMGFYHFDQLANWGPDEVAWVDENLEGFKGRVSRDNWVDQAKLLASGGETAFSKKVEGGDVY